MVKKMIDENFRILGLTKNTIESSLKEHTSDNELNLFCEGCGSESLVENNNGYYVCTWCGLIVEGMQIYMYNSPFNEEIIATSANPLKRTTSIGTKIERRRNPRSIDLERIAKMQSISRNYENLVYQTADAELKRIITALRLPKSLKSHCLEVFRMVWKKLKKSSKARSPENLVPVILFMVLKVRAIAIDYKEFIEILKNDKENFKEVLIDAALLYPPYLSRDRKPLILKKLAEIREHFGFDSEFSMLSYEIMEKFWRYINLTKDDVIVGVISSLAIIGLDVEDISVSNICDKIGIRMSTINYQVKNKIFEKMRISGFSSLIKSSILIKNLVLDTVLLTQEEQKEEEGAENLVQVQEPQILSEETSIQESQVIDHEGLFQQEENEIIILDESALKAHYFNVNYEAFRDLVPASMLKESIKLIVRSKQRDPSDPFHHVISSQKTRLKFDLHSNYEKYRWWKGKGPPW